MAEEPLELRDLNTLTMNRNAAVSHAAGDFCGITYPLDNPQTIHFYWDGGRNPSTDVSKTEHIKPHCLHSSIIYKRLAYE